MLEVIRRGLNLFSIKITVPTFLVKTWKLKLLRCLVYVLEQNKNKTKQKTKTTIIKNKENFKSNLALVMTLQSKGLYWCILMSGSRIVSQQ